MNVEKIHIGAIPAMLFGEKSDNMIIAVHGSHSSKIDDCVWILAEEATKRGYSVLSFDLPQHGERVYESEPCKVAECVLELERVTAFARENEKAKKISVFGCSMGAYFALLAFARENIARAWFLSPVVDMERLINDIMLSCGVTEKDLEARGVIENPFETLYYDYYQYVKAHRITAWPHATYILRGENDAVSPRGVTAGFCARFGCELTEQKGGEHWFHTPGELAFFRDWISARLD